MSVLSAEGREGGRGNRKKEEEGKGGEKEGKAKEVSLNVHSDVHIWHSPVLILLKVRPRKQNLMLNLRKHWEGCISAENKGSWIEIQVLMHPCYVTLNKCLNPFGFQFPCL